MNGVEGAKRVLRFGNLEDVIFCKKAGWQVIQDKINALYVEWAEYDDLDVGPAPVEDPFVQELIREINLLESEQKLILLDIEAFEQELALQKSSSNNP